MVVNKRGDQKYYIIISLILGLLILAISLYWIFQEYFNEDEIDWEVCRQSILLRATLPEKDLVVLKTDVKGAFPLKCKTEVVEIDDLSTPDKVYKKIANAVAEGWYMFGEGEWDFIASEILKNQQVCMVFARVHFNEEMVKDFEKNGDYLSAWFDVSGNFGQGFYNYYIHSELESSDETYNDYFPVYVNEISKNGNLMVLWSDMSKMPFWDNFDDYLLIYRRSEASGVGDSSLMRSLASIFVPSFLPGMGGNEEYDVWKSKKSIWVVSSDSLDLVGCDKFLTIPA